MDLKPLPANRYRMISGSRPPFRTVVWHYGKQVVGYAFSKVKLGFSRLSKRFRKNWWVFLPLIPVGGIAWAVYYNILQERISDHLKAVELADEAKRAESDKAEALRTNSTYAHKYVDEWSKAFLGPLVSTCSEAYGNDPPYHCSVSCFIGAKDTLPTKKLECTELGCILSNVP